MMMPGPGESGSITTAAPTPRSDIRRAASRSVCCGPTVRTTRSSRHVPASQPHSSRIACNDCLNVTLAVATRTRTNQIQPERRRASLGSCRSCASCRTHVRKSLMPHQRSSTVRLRTSLYEEAVAIVERGVRRATLRSTTSPAASRPRGASCSAPTPRSATRRSARI